MATIYELKKRAKELAAVSETNTVDPARVGNLIDDTLELIDEYDKNVVSLGIRKTYATVAAMEADKASPSGDDGKKLRFGQLVSVYDAGNVEAVDSGKVFAFQNPGWKLSSRVDAGYARSEKVAELEKKWTGIYDMTATGSNISHLHGIKDLVIENPVAGRVYTVASVEAPGASGNYVLSIFSASDNVGSNALLIARFNISNTNPSNGKVNYYKAKGARGENIHILIKWEDINAGVYTTMWGDKYKLKDSVFGNGNISEMLVDFLFEKHQEQTLAIARQMTNYDALPDASTNVNAANINKTIKQLYITKKATAPVYMAAFSNGYERASGIKTYQLGLYLDSSNAFLNFEKSIPLAESYNESVVLFKTSGDIQAVAIVDWNAVAAFSSSSNFSADFIISEKCFKDVYNLNAIAILENLFTGLEINKLEEKTKSLSRIVNGDTKTQDAILEMFFIEKSAIQDKLLTLKTMYKLNGYNITITDQNNAIVASSSKIVQTSLNLPKAIHALMNGSKTIIGYCFVDWSMVVGNGVQGTGTGIINSDKIDTLHGSSEIAHYLFSETKASVDNLTGGKVIYKDYTNMSVNKSAIANAIKEIYVEGGCPDSEKYFALSVVQRNSRGTWAVKLYEMPGVKLVSNYLVTENPEKQNGGYQLVKATGIRTAYFAINWSRIADGSSYTSMTAPTNQISGKCFDLFENQGIAAALSNDFIDIVSKTVYSKIFKIGNYNNEFQFDYLTIGQAMISALQMKLNFNIPTTGAYISTDVENTTYRNNPTLEQLLKAFTPYFYYDGTKQGTIVLYDEDGSPFIYNQNGNKIKLLTQ